MTFYKFYFDGANYVCEHLAYGKSMIKYDEAAFDTLEGLFREKYNDARVIDDQVVFINGEERIIVENFSEVIDYISEEAFDNMTVSIARGMARKYNNEYIIEQNAKAKIDKVNKKSKVNKISKLTLGMASCLSTVILSAKLVNNYYAEAYNMPTEDAAAQELVSIPDITNVTDKLIEAKTIENVEIEEVASLLDDRVLSRAAEFKNLELETVFEDTIFYNASSELEEKTRISIQGVQSGISYNNTNYVYFYNKWVKSSGQKALADEWDEKGRTSDRGIATIDGRYLVAMTDTFGIVGDYVDVVLRDGTIIPCIIADVKSSSDENCNKYGHLLAMGSSAVGVDVIEWEAVAEKDDIDLTGWFAQGVDYVITYEKDKIKTLN